MLRRRAKAPPLPRRAAAWAVAALLAIGAWLASSGWMQRSSGMASHFMPSSKVSGDRFVELPEPAAEAAIPSSVPRSLPRDVVVTIGRTQGNWSYLVRFFGSLRAHMPIHEVDIVFFTDPGIIAQTGFREVQRRFNISTVIYDRGFMTEFIDPKSKQGFQLTFFRARQWVVRRWVQSLTQDAYKDMFITDLRDSVFQGHVFKEVRKVAPTADVVAFQEDGRFTIGSEPVNERWVRKCGARNDSGIFEKPISCAGTVFATLQGMRTYLDEMTTGLLNCSQAGTDQGMHNVMVYEGRLSKHGLSVTVLSLEHGPVATMGFMKNVHLDIDGRVLNQDGMPYAVLHQFDRWTSVFEIFSNRYAYPFKRSLVLTEATMRAPLKSVLSGG